MAKPITTHTMESLHAKCIEEGECWLWQGFLQNGSPYVNHGGKLMAVRRVTVELSGRTTRLGAKYFSATCGNLTCINPDHVAARTPREHGIRMGHSVQHNAPARVAKLQAKGRARTVSKLNQEQATSIFSDDRPHREIAAEHGISKSLVSHIKRGIAWRNVSAANNPWAGLLAA